MVARKFLICLVAILLAVSAVQSDDLAEPKAEDAISQLMRRIPTNEASDPSTSLSVLEREDEVPANVLIKRRRKHHHRKGHGRGKGHDHRKPHKSKNKHHGGKKQASPATTNNDQDDNQSSRSSSKKAPLTPNGIKAGIAGGQSLDFIKGAIGWYTEWTAVPYGQPPKGVAFATMLWGLGWKDHDNDWQRFQDFKKIKPGTYDYVIGMNEADFEGGGSSGVIPTDKAAEAWEQYIAPHGRAGSVLISPSCAKQADENWMGPFLKKVKTKPDVVNVHIFKNKASQIKGVLDHYAQYGYPLWVTEFACINYSNGAHDPCNQKDAEEFVRESVKILEADDRVKAYAWSDANNGPACKLTKAGGKQLSKTGQTLKAMFSSFA
ncbi:hypothetical protein L7F22_019783 [Adiantum nelumboides]|nr:hypothetical protein [Adiantum nelumboides]